MAKMTQTQIFAEMSTKTGISKKQVKDFILAFTDLAYREAKKGEFAIPGFGKLVKQKRKARIGRNPATGEEIKIPAKTVLKFRVAKAATADALGMPLYRPGDGGSRSRQQVCRSRAQPTNAVRRQRPLADHLQAEVAD